MNISENIRWECINQICLKKNLSCLLQLWSLHIQELHLHPRPATYTHFVVKGFLQCRSIFFFFCFVFLFFSLWHPSSFWWVGIPYIKYIGYQNKALKHLRNNSGWSVANLQKPMKSRQHVLGEHINTAATVKKYLQLWNIKWLLIFTWARDKIWICGNFYTDWHSW